MSTEQLGKSLVLKSNLKIKHPSIEKELLELTFNVDLGTNSMFSVVDGDVVIDYVDGLKDGNPTLYLKPIPNQKVVNGIIRITDTNNPCLYDEQEIMFFQENGIFTEYEFIALNQERYDPCKDDRCKIDKDEVIEYECDNWITKTRISWYSQNGLSLINSFNNADKKGKITVKCRPYENIYDEPIFINGYDKEGNLITSTVFYLSYIYGEKSEEKCELIVSPSSMVIPNDEFDSDITFVCNTSKDEGNVSAVVDSKVVSTSFITNNSVIFTLKPRELGLKKEETDNSVKEINFVLDGCNTVKRQVILLKYIDASKLHDITVDNEKIIITENMPQEIHVNCEEMWYIYDYSDDIVDCYKNSNNIVITPLTFVTEDEQNKLLETEEPNAFITLKNNSGKTCTIQIVSAVLEQKDTYVFEWKDNKTGIDNPVTYNYYRDNYSNFIDTFTSYCELAINGHEREKGEWKVVSSNNVRYTVEQYISGKWLEINSTHIGTTKDDYTVNVYLNVTPTTPQEYDVWIHTDDVFSNGADGFVTFYQTNENAIIKMNIHHDKVVRYRVYTDQDGFINVK